MLGVVEHQDLQMDVGRLYSLLKNIDINSFGLRMVMQSA